MTDHARSVDEEVVFVLVRLSLKQVRDLSRTRSIQAGAGGCNRMG
jgi:hypothetical protein